MGLQCYNMQMILFSWSRMICSKLETWNCCFISLEIPVWFENQFWVKWGYDNYGRAHCFAELFNFLKGSWPIKYLGTHVCARRTIVVELSFLGGKTRKNMRGWVANSMSIGGRLIKIDACRLVLLFIRCLWGCCIKPIYKKWINLLDYYSGLVVLTKQSTTLWDGSGFVTKDKRGPGCEGLV
jgi:hypothetical protein